MEFTIKVHEKDKYISVVTDGEITVKDMGVFGKQFVQKEQETGIRRVLIDIRKSRIKANLIDAFTYTAGSQIPILPGEKNAILVDPKSHDLLKVRIYMAQSMISGLHVRKFIEEKEALDWLLL